MVSGIRGGRPLDGRRWLHWATGCPTEAADAASRQVVVTLCLVLGLAGCSGEVATPGMGGPGSPPGTTPDGGGILDESLVAYTPVRRLTRSQYDNTVRDLLGLELNLGATMSRDDTFGPFAANFQFAITELQLSTYMSAAETIAAEAVKNLPALVPCASAGGDAQCAEEFIRAFGPKAFRRPLDDQEVAGLLAVYEFGASQDFTSGIELVLSAMLQSPAFLYQTETAPADEPAPLDGYALASRLSYFLWDSMPDDALFAAAADGTLLSPEGIREQTTRMLADDRAKAGIGKFFVSLLKVEGVPDVAKFREFLRFDRAIGEAMKRETIRFTDHVVRKGDGTLYTLMKADWSFLEEPLFPIYGIAKPPDFDPEKPVALPRAERSGILTQLAFLTYHGGFQDTSPVKRGHLVYENLYCKHAEIPPTLDIPPLPDPMPGQTARERFAAHTSAPACAGCHKLFDPMGFAFEAYDVIGQVRTADRYGNPVESDGEVEIGDPLTDGSFDGALDFIDKTLNSPTFQDCFVQQWHRFALKRADADADERSLREVRQAFIASNYNVRELILNLVTTDAFRMQPAVSR